MKLQSIYLCVLAVWGWIFELDGGSVEPADCHSDRFMFLVFYPQIHAIRGCYRVGTRVAVMRGHACASFRHFL